MQPNDDNDVSYWLKTMLEHDNKWHNNDRPSDNKTETYAGYVGGTAK